MSSRNPPEDWIEPFKEILRKGGCEIDDEILTGARNVFRVRLNGKELIVVGAGSTKIGFWGIRIAVIEMMSRMGQWGAVFLNLKGNIAYWVPGPNVLKLSDSRYDQQYLFHDARLAENWEMAYSFGGDTVEEVAENFILKSGLGTTFEEEEE